MLWNISSMLQCTADVISESLEIGQICPSGGYWPKMSTLVFFLWIIVLFLWIILNISSTSHLISECLEALNSGDFSFFIHGVRPKWDRLGHIACLRAKISFSILCFCADKKYEVNLSENFEFWYHFSKLTYTYSCWYECDLCPRSPTQHYMLTCVGHLNFW